MSKNNRLILFIVLGLVFIFGVYCMIDKKYESYNKLPERFKNANSKKVKKTKQSPPDIEFLGGSGSGNMEENDAFELLGVASNDPALQLQFGVGEGIYGSGRYSSSMVGN